MCKRKDSYLLGFRTIIIIKYEMKNDYMIQYDSNIENRFSTRHIYMWKNSCKQNFALVSGIFKGR